MTKDYRKELWIAVATRSTTFHDATHWANEALKDFDEAFKGSEVEVFAIHDPDRPRMEYTENPEKLPPAELLRYLYDYPNTSTIFVVRALRDHAAMWKNEKDEFKHMYEGLCK